jgi:hypothetical protein
MRTILALFSILMTLPLLTGCPPAADDDDNRECTNFSGHAFPVVIIEAPDNRTSFDVGNTLNFIVTVTDEDSEVTDMVMVVEDTINNDAVEVDVTVPSPDEDGRVEFRIEFDELGQGTHTVRVSTEDSDGCEGDDTVVVCLDDPAVCQ